VLLPKPMHRTRRGSVPLTALLLCCASRSIVESGQWMFVSGESSDRHGLECFPRIARQLQGLAAKSRHRAGRLIRGELEMYCTVRGRTIDAAFEHLQFCAHWSHHHNAKGLGHSRQTWSMTAPRVEGLLESSPPVSSAGCCSALRGCEATS